MQESKQDSREDEDDTGLDIEGIEESIRLDSGTPLRALELESGCQDADDPGGDIFPELVYIEDNDSRTTFDFNGIRDRANSQLKTTGVLLDDLDPS